MPKTRLGRWAGGLAVALLALVLFLILTIGRQNMAGGGGMSWLQPGEPLAIGLGTLMLAAGIASLATGLVSLTKFKDRSVVVILAIIAGLLAALILAMELLEALGPDVSCPPATEIQYPPGPSGRTGLLFR